MVAFIGSDIVESSRKPVQSRALIEGVEAKVDGTAAGGSRVQSEEAWNDAVAFTRDKSPASFDQWFSGVQFDGLTDGVLCLRARDEFVRQWVEDYFLPTLAERLRDRTGLSIQLRWSIDGSLERPVADRPAAEERKRKRKENRKNEKR